MIIAIEISKCTADEHSPIANEISEEKKEYKGGMEMIPFMPELQNNTMKKGN